MNAAAVARVPFSLSPARETQFMTCIVLLPSKELIPWPRRSRHKHQTPVVLLGSDVCCQKRRQSNRMSASRPRPRSRRPRSLRPLSRRRRLSAGLQARDGEGAGRCGGAGPLQVTMLPTRLLLQPAAKDSTPFPAPLPPSLPLQP